jgi:hypothetical protein
MLKKYSACGLLVCLTPIFICNSWLIFAKAFRNGTFADFRREFIANYVPSRRVLAQRKAYGIEDSDLNSGKINL